MAFYPTLFGYVELPDPDLRRPRGRGEHRLVRRLDPRGDVRRP